MTVDPAFGAVVAVPIIVLAIACAWSLRLDRRWAALAVAGCAFGFIVGCTHSEDTTGTQGPAAAVTPAGAPAAAPAPAATPRPIPLTDAQTKAALAAKREAGTIAIDVLDDHQGGMRTDTSLSIPATGTAYVVGWAFEEAKGAPCSAVAVVVDEKRVFPASYSYARPDVAAHFNNPGVTKVGYAAVISGAKLGAGTHEARAVCVQGAVAMRSHRALSITVQ